MKRKMFVLLALVALGLTLIAARTTPTHVLAQKHDKLIGELPDGALSTGIRFTNRRKPLSRATRAAR